MDDWFQSFLEDTREAHDFAAEMVYENKDLLTVIGWSTQEVWDTGVPVLKMFNANRYSPQPIIVPSNTPIKVIHTHSLASNVGILYWLLDKTWFSVLGDGNTQDMLEHCKEKSE